LSGKGGKPQGGGEIIGVDGEVAEG
jgi:hypothetical protein